MLFFISAFFFSSFFRGRRRALALSVYLSSEHRASLTTMSNSQPGTSAPAAAAPTSEQQLDLVREAMKAKPLMGPSSSSSSRVHRDESVYSFDTPFSPGGLYVNLSTWQVCLWGW